MNAPHAAHLSIKLLVVDTLSMQQEREKAEEAKGFLEDAYAAITALEQQVDHLSKKMRKVASGLHMAINPTHQVRSKPKYPRLLPLCPPLSASCTLTLPLLQGMCMARARCCEGCNLPLQGIWY